MTHSYEDTRITQVHMLPDGRMDSENAALYLGLRPKTLAMMRCDGSGPRFIKRGRIFYFQSDLDAWINDAGKFQSTAQVRVHQQESVHED